MTARGTNLGRGVIACLALSLAGCSEPPTTPSYVSNAAFTIIDVVVGTGDEAVVGKRVEVDYNAYLYHPTQSLNRGTLVDTSANLPAPFQFQLGAGEVIPGWEQGVLGMRAGGGTRRLVVPPALAYGSAGSGPVPPNATMVFEIVLYTVRDP